MHLQSELLANFLLMSAVWKAESLQCLSCFGVLDAKVCNTTVTCSDEQVCYTKREFTDQVRFELGCVDKRICGIEATPQTSTTDKEIHSGQIQNCYECCSTPDCNKELCDNSYQCDDSESVDCNFLNTTISICEITVEAKKICRHYCDLCRVDGMWSSWSEWSKCDVTCDNGTQSRTRSCTNPAPKYGGLKCSEKGIEIQTCQQHLCPVHGGWRDWENWEKCSATCGIGMQSRIRSCTNPVPDRFGYHCFGQSMEYKLCDQNKCEDKRVAFTAHGLKYGDAAIFPVIDQNYGGGYSSSTGKFTCQVPGIYYFSSTLAKNYNSENGYVQCFLQINSISKVGAFVNLYNKEDDKDRFFLTILGSFHLNKNDVAQIHCPFGKDVLDYNNELFCSFSGFLIIPDN